MDLTLLKWFRFQRTANIPISGPIIKEKVTQFGTCLGYRMLYELDKPI